MPLVEQKHYVNHCLSFGSFSLTALVLSFRLRIKTFDCPYCIFNLSYHSRKFIAISLEFNQTFTVVFHSNTPHCRVHYVLFALAMTKHTCPSYQLHTFRFTGRCWYLSSLSSPEQLLSWLSDICIGIEESPDKRIHVIGDIFVVRSEWKNVTIAPPRPLLWYFIIPSECCNWLKHPTH